MLVGNYWFSGTGATYISLAINPVDNLPYVTYEDYGNDTHAAVMK